MTSLKLNLVVDVAICISSINTALAKERGVEFTVLKSSSANVYGFSEKNIFEETAEVK